ncbi:hypothetical protein [Pseudaminobacter soli (ex Li et al. 2025)]|uniref:Uncharacterized protein n=1 Tax=Pseudaminobacter soli (ex Li et al. 2025) TaxID=1295366 RepID=A0A2P7SE66_9HYPH|nr:hypothetical protein [Mesorhizobium soli]PSJ60802.1 hypothetical protein C7I85_12225 [Mesorhizobium soli]
MTTPVLNKEGRVITALEWNEYHDEQGNPERWDAETTFNTYYGIALLHDGYSVEYDYADVAKALDSLDAAKAAAVADCAKRCTAYLSASLPADVAGVVARIQAHCEGDRESLSGIPLLREAAALISALSADNERLREGRDAWADERVEILRKGTAWRARAEASEARVRELEAALEPFAVIAGAVFRVDEDGREMNAGKPDDHAVWGFDRVGLRYGHLRAARSVAKEAGNV